MAQSKLSVGTFFQEVGEDGVLYHYWILAVAKSQRAQDADGQDVLDQLELLGNLAQTAVYTDEKKRITWDITGMITAEGMSAVR